MVRMIVFLVCLIFVILMSENPTWPGLSHYLTIIVMEPFVGGHLGQSMKRFLKLMQLNDRLAIRLSLAGFGFIGPQSDYEDV